MTYLMGLGRPTLAGTGLSCSGETCVTLSRGVQRYASSVQAASCLRKCFFVGRSMMLNVPGNNTPMNCVSGVLFLPGTGPFGFAMEIKPLPFATRRCLASGVMRTEVGYQPTGMNPSERLLPMVETSNTATLLLQALAT